MLRLAIMDTSGDLHDVDYFDDIASCLSSIKNYLVQVPFSTYPDTVIQITFEPINEEK